MSFRIPTHLSSFHWDSSLSDERKEQIIEWCKSLPSEQRQLLEDLLDNQHRTSYENGYDDGAAYECDGVD